MFFSTLCEQEVCPKMLCVWGTHNAWAGSGGDCENCGSGSQFPCQLLHLWGLYICLEVNVMKLLINYEKVVRVTLSLWLCCRSVVCCSHLKERVEVVTLWTVTFCARAAVPEESRISPPKSPLTANNHLLISFTTFGFLFFFFYFGPFKGYLRTCYWYG